MFSSLDTARLQTSLGYHSASSVCSKLAAGWSGCRLAGFYQPTLDARA